MRKFQFPTKRKVKEIPGENLLKGQEIPTLLMEKFKRWSFKGTFFFSKAIIIILAKERTQEGFEQSSYQKVCNFQSVDLCLIIYLPQQYLRGAKNRVNFLSVH